MLFNVGLLLKPTQQYLKRRLIMTRISTSFGVDVDMLLEKVIGVFSIKLLDSSAENVKKNEAEEMFVFYLCFLYGVEATQAAVDLRLGTSR